eukprot:SAG31_NODE_3445_length_4259_cov_4.763702_3_plen_142_part_00
MLRLSDALAAPVFARSVGTQRPWCTTEHRGQMAATALLSLLADGLRRATELAEFDEGSFRAFAAEVRHCALKTFVPATAQLASSPRHFHHVWKGFLWLAFALSAPYPTKPAALRPEGPHTITRLVFITVVSTLFTLVVSTC